MAYLADLSSWSMDWAEILNSSPEQLVYGLGLVGDIELHGCHHDGPHHFIGGVLKVDPEHILPGQDRDPVLQLWVLVSARNVQKHHDSALQLVLLLVLLLDWVGLNLGGAGQLLWVHQLVLTLG